jgi:hypothetical protein
LVPIARAEVELMGRVPSQQCKIIIINVRKEEEAGGMERRKEREKGRN